MPTPGRDPFARAEACDDRAVDGPRPGRRRRARARAAPAAEPGASRRRRRCAPGVAVRGLPGPGRRRTARGSRRREPNRWPTRITSGSRCRSSARVTLVHAVLERDLVERLTARTTYTRGRRPALARGPARFQTRATVGAARERRRRQPAPRSPARCKRVRATSRSACAACAAHVTARFLRRTARSSPRADPLP